LSKSNEQGHISENGIYYDMTISPKKKKKKLFAPAHITNDTGILCKSIMGKTEVIKMATNSEKHQIWNDAIELLPKSDKYHGPIHSQQKGSLV
jgi:hypothetical protein